MSDEIIKIDLRDLKQYVSKCHLCGKDLTGDDVGIKKCSDENCRFRLLNNRIPFKEKKPKKGGGKCCGG
jgi:hypothetical protein